jgi:outer membrane protein assembly factor BamC
LIRLARALPDIPSPGRLLGALVASLLLAACGSTTSISDLARVEYRSAKQGEKLDIPPDLVSPRRDNRFALPERGTDGSATTYSAYARERTTDRRTGAAGVLPEVVGARIERQGDQRWLVVDLPAAKVWPVVRSFWIDSGFSLTTDSPETGILETDWAESRPPVPGSFLRNLVSRAMNPLYVTSERDRFRSRLEAVGDSTEIFLSHRGMVEEFSGAQKDSTTWVQRRGDKELEAEFLRRLMLRFTGPQQAAAQQAVGGGAPVAPRTVLVQGDSVPTLRIGEGFDRAWRQVGLALDRSGFTVEDRDRSLGTYFVRYVDPQAESRSQGIFARVFGGAGDRDLTGRRYRIVIVADAPSPSGQPSSIIRVLDEQGVALDSNADRRVATQIATLLQEQLR